MGIHSDFVGIISVCNCSIQSNLAVFLVVNSANLEAILVSPEQTRLLPTVSRRTTSHHRCLGEYTRATVGIWAFTGINGGKSNGIMIVLAEMEMSAEPTLDAAMLTDQLNELAAILLVGMVEPAASVDNMILLQDTQSRSIGWGVRKDKYLPALIGRMLD